VRLAKVRLSPGGQTGTNTVAFTFNNSALRRLVLPSLFSSAGLVMRKSGVLARHHAKLLLRCLIVSEMRAH
jgi:hypothetical protein